MAVTQIIAFAPEAVVGVVDKKIQEVAETLKRIGEKVVIGTQVQDKTIQITSEWDEIQTSSSSITSLGSPTSFFHVALNRPAFGSGDSGPARANIVEYVQVSFPASRATPEFKQQIEDDFAKFDEIFRTEAVGGEALAIGWVVEELDHEGVEGGKAKSFFVVRGWESMGQFERSIQNEAYKRAIPILLGWQAPFKMWHVERRS